MFWTVRRCDHCFQCELEFTFDQEKCKKTDLMFSFKLEVFGVLSLLCVGALLPALRVPVSATCLICGLHGVQV